jgi:hypothetical protein
MLLSLLLLSRLLVFKLLLVLRGEIGLPRPSSSINFSIYIGLDIRLSPYS